MNNAAAVTQIPTIDSLAQEVLELKAQESTLAKIRKSKESQLADLVGVEQEGSRTEKTERYKITTTQPIRRTVTDANGLYNSIGENFFNQLIRQKYDLNVKDLKAIQKHNPPEYRKIAPYIEAKPGSVSVKIEEFKQCN